MYLKSLELHGFKSFPNRTVMTFDRGATVIVGPNGSGKSNISDAMRWVLGELSSRNLRGNRMEDVIFGGADSKRPMNFAEVSVTFDNSDPQHRIDTPYEEITVTRRYFRNGNSEYEINHKPCRLRDIFEMFMNTGVGREGYSIIGQGKIAEIISKKSEDRRNFFEEAAGISKFRHRKRDAENKLQQTEANMVREQDIFNELHARYTTLEKDAEKARKYLTVAEEKRQADVSLWLYDTQKLRTDIEKYKDETALSGRKLEIITEALDDLEKQVSQIESQTVASRVRSEELLAAINEITEKLHNADSRFQLSESESEHIRSLIAQCRDRIGEIEREKSDIGAESDAIREKIGEFTTQRDDLSDRRLQLLADQQKAMEQVMAFDRELENEQQQISRMEAEVADYAARCSMLGAATADGGSKYENLSREIEGYEQKSVELQKEVERCDKSTAAFREKIAEAEARMNEAQTREHAAQAEKDELTAAYNTACVTRDAMLERGHTLKRMEEQLEGYGGGIRFVMDKAEAGALRGEVCGPVSKLIHIQQKYVTAIETALGPSIQHVVVDSDDTAKECIRLLRENKAGRATFLPIATIRPSAVPEDVRAAARQPGYVDRADRLTECDDRYRPIVEWLLSRTVIFDTLDHANAAARALQRRVRIVTLEGDIMNVGGSMTGGANKNEGSGILSRSAQIDRIFEAARIKDEEIKKTEKKLDELTKALTEARQDFRDAEQNRELLHTMSRAQFAAFDKATAEREANENLLTKLRADIEELKNTRSRSEIELEELTRKRAEVEAAITDLRERREKKSVERNACDDHRIELGEQASELQLRMAEITKDIESAEAQIGQNEQRADALDAEIAGQQGRIAEHEQGLAQQEQLRTLNRAESEDLRAQIDELKNSRTNLEAGMTDSTGRVSELREKIKQKNAEKEICYKTNANMEAKLQQLMEDQDRTGSHLYEEYELTYEQAVALNYPEVTRENRAQVVQQLTSAKNRLRAMGSVNPQAVEEFAEVKARHDELEVQLSDLKKSKEELIGIIARLENEMKINFVDAFERINQNFSVVFRELFGGGQAQLELTDRDDVLNCGIEIRVAPPGKIIKSLSLLSGGEQSFVAIALFFAIIKVNPTPFCILDEVEAALDEVNVNRFGAYIHKMTSETQFILITHRRGTMEIAERLYGVTMPEKGISRVIGINVDEIDTVQKELLDEIS